MQMNFVALWDKLSSYESHTALLRQRRNVLRYFLKLHRDP